MTQTRLTGRLMTQGGVPLGDSISQSAYGYRNELAQRHDLSDGDERDPSKESAPKHCT
ncbi:hypothetical protein BgiMline_002198, partial [Biomphalaria glabrata]